MHFPYCKMGMIIMIEAISLGSCEIVSVLHIKSESAWYIEKHLINVSFYYFKLGTQIRYLGGRNI